MNLLPGLRELRTPLATGYIWLLTLWFTLYNHIPARGKASGIAQSAYQLVDFLGKPALLAAASFLAFLIGLVQVDPGTIRNVVFRLVGHNTATWLLRRMPRGEIGVPPTVSESSMVSLHDFLANMTREVGIERGKFLTPDRSVKEVVAQVIGDLRATAIRLQVDKPDLYQAYDRKAAEADFRVNVGLAIGGLSLGLAVAGGDGWFATGLLITLMMIRSGIYRQQTANDLLVETLTSRVLTSPTINAYEVSITPRPDPKQR